MDMKERLKGNFNEWIYEFVDMNVSALSSAPSAPLEFVHAHSVWMHYSDWAYAKGYLVIGESRFLTLLSKAGIYQDISESTGRRIVEIRFKPRNSKGNP
jgi:hypothetical protein